MSEHENKVLVRKYYEALNSTDDATSVINEYMAKDFISHEAWKNREGLIKVINEWKAAFPDFRYNVEDVIAEEEKIAVRIRFSGISQDVSAIIIFRIVNGKIVEQWAHGQSFF